MVSIKTTPFTKDKLSITRNFDFGSINIQWLSEQMECGNLQIGKEALALWIPMTQK